MRLPKVLNVLIPNRYGMAYIPRPSFFIRSVHLATCRTGHFFLGPLMSTETLSQFKELGLAPHVLKAIDDVGYETPSPIQAASIPPLLEGRDLVGQAQTGTGKTAAFALPLLSRLDLTQAHPQALILTPTRELAIQVAEAMHTYARHLKDFHVLPLYGGQNIGIQLRRLKRRVHVVVGTPGRLLDHLRRGTLRLDNLTTVVLDEADEMLRMGFIEDVEEILDHTPSERQVALFSATMPKPIRRIAQRHLKEPVEIHIEAKTATVETVSQRFWEVTRMKKLDALTRILEVEEFDAMLIFARTKIATTELAEKLEARGYASSALNGDMNQAQREKTVERLKSGALDIVIATDVAARGLDVERISHVVNYDIPYDAETYVHRIGRTGRAGRTGEAILFVRPRERRMLRAIEKATRQRIAPMQLPTNKDIAERRIAQFKVVVAEALASQDLGFFEDLVSSYQVELDIDLTELAAALAFLVQRERPLVPSGRDVPQASESQRQGDRRDRERGGSKYAEQGMVRYRIDVGRDHGAEPRNIVGAIANEGDISSRLIGHIKLYGVFSTVDLPQDLPKELIRHLKKVRVSGRPLNIRLDAPPGKKNKRTGPRSSKSGKKKHKAKASRGKKRR